MEYNLTRKTVELIKLTINKNNIRCDETNYLHLLQGLKRKIST